MGDEIPFARQDAVLGGLARVVVPKLLDVPVAYFHFLDLRNLGIGQRNGLGASLQRPHLCGRILLEVDGIDEQRASRFGDKAEPMRTHQHGVTGPKARRQRLPLLLELDVARVGIGRDAAFPARRARAHRHELDAFHHREGNRELHMRVQYGLYVRARLQDLGMDRQLDRRRAIPFQHRAVVVADQHRLRLDLGARGGADLDDEGVTTRNACRYVPAVVEDSFGLEQPRHRRDVPLDLIGCGRRGGCTPAHLTPILLQKRSEISGVGSWR